MLNRESLVSSLRQLALVGALSVVTTAVFVLTPLGYSRFSWQALGQPYDDGATCVSPSECTSTFCTDGFCCNSECSGDGQSCDVAGSEGICQTEAMAPVLSGGGQLVAVIAVLAGGFLGLYLRRREE